jgi:hypothetical protein
VLDVFLMGLIYDQSTLVTRNDEDHQIGVTTRLNQTNIEAVRFGLKGRRNFPDAQGNDIPFEIVQKVVGVSKKGKHTRSASLALPRLARAVAGDRDPVHDAAVAVVVVEWVMEARAVVP